MDLDNSVSKGRHLVAESLKAAGVEYVFGIVGYPVIELGFALQDVGIKYVGMRNEQSASYAAAAMGYLTGKPGVCLVVPGPGVIHALAGLANAAANGWPMICLAGSSELEQDGLGAFQESLPPQGGSQIQHTYTLQMCKYSVKVTSAARFPFFLDQALRYATHGRPGPVYLEVAGDTLRDPLGTPELIGEEFRQKLRDVLKQRPVDLISAPESKISEAVNMLKSAKKPLVIFGKGAAYAGASESCRKFVEQTGIPFLPSPMGKGVVEDDHPLCASSARSHVLKNADVILLVGARLNWILHYGLPPRYREDVKFIHVELLPEEVDASRKASVALVGNAKVIMEDILKSVSHGGFNKTSLSAWTRDVDAVKQSSMQIFKELADDRDSPMNYYCALGIVNKFIPKDALIVNEGSDTMDIGRTTLLNYEPKSRLDAGSWGTMGVGMGQAIACSLVRPNPGCVFVAGDSAFGFSAMEFEVITRYNLPVIVVIINNNGIGPYNMDGYTGENNSTEERLLHPAKSLAPQTRYEKIAEAFGTTGVFVDNADALESAMQAATSQLPFKPTIINCMISTVTSRGKPAAPPYAKAGKL